MPRTCAEWNGKEWVRRPLTPAEEAQRDADKAKHEEKMREPAPPTIEERLAVIEAALGIKPTSAKRTP